MIDEISMIFNEKRRDEWFVKVFRFLIADYLLKNKKNSAILGTEEASESKKSESKKNNDS